MKKAVLLAPHLDDELLIGGGLLYALARDNNWCVYVVFMTNGDYYAYEAETRLKEAIASCDVLGVKEEYVIFLGYGDQWKGKKHIYNMPGEVAVSHCERTETYALDFHSEYSYQKEQRHRQYTRDNLKSDIKKIISDLLPEVLLCVDFDSHPDHKALSLLFSECIGEILKNDLNYKPLILKKLAYEGVYNGENDYYCVPHRPTKCTKGELKSTPILKWQERISLAVPRECDTLLLANNVLFKAAKKYKSQRFKFIIPKAINSDIVYWRQFTENFALSANVKATSGVAEYLNDFKTIDSDNILTETKKLSASVWHPSLSDPLKKAIFEWPEEILIREICIYENPDFKSNILLLKILVHDEYSLEVDYIQHDGSKTQILFEPIKTKKIELMIAKWEGPKPGISEVEVFNEKSSFESYGLPCQVNKYFELSGNKCVIFEKVISCLGSLFMGLNEVYEFKLCPNKYFMQRKYSILRTNIYLLPLFWVIDIIKRIVDKICIFKGKNLLENKMG
ncbi:PIG-L family deacetylase [bacterium 1XD21-13]|nr:PIG-L family deacetylase [bacterium 1XD21-13]